MIPFTCQTRYARAEERLGNTRLESGSQLYVHRHKLPISGNVEKLTAIAPPLGLTAAAGRDSPLASGGRKSLGVDLRRSRLVRSVNYPFPVRRELRLLFVELRLQKRKW